MGLAGVVGGEGQISLSSCFEVDFFTALSFMSQVWFSVCERVCVIGVDIVVACLCGFFGFGSKAVVLFLVRIGGFPFAVFLVFEFGATTFFLVRIDAVVFGIFVSWTVAGCRFEANVPVVVLVDGFISV